MEIAAAENLGTGTQAWACVGPCSILTCTPQLFLPHSSA